MIGLTKSLAADLVTRQVKLQVCPFSLWTDLCERDLPGYGGDAELAGPRGREPGSCASQEGLHRQVGHMVFQPTFVRQKMGRLGTAEEIANLVLYLSSNEVRHTCITILSPSRPTPRGPCTSLTAAGASEASLDLLYLQVQVPSNRLEAAASRA